VAQATFLLLLHQLLKKLQRVRRKPAVMIVGKRKHPDLPLHNVPACLHAIFQILRPVDDRLIPGLRQFLDSLAVVQPANNLPLMREIILQGSAILGADKLAG
jgi:hypothetical protein